MSYDQKVPAQLKEIQNWFGSIIVRPIDRQNKMMPISPSGVLMEDEACRYISPSPTLKPDQRIELYNQQYWWRLLSIMQDNFPLLARLFGHTDFNEAIAEPYLVKYPPRHWSLNFLGDRLLYWIEEDYIEDDKDLVRDAALLDYSFLMSFLASEKPSLNLQETDPDEISEKPLFLQPHLFLFAFDGDMIRLRKEMLKESVEHWVEHDFPALDRTEKHYYVLYRNTYLNVNAEEIDALEFEALQLFRKGISIDAFCEWIEALEPDKAEKAEKALPAWFQRWSAHAWLTLDGASPSRPGN